MVTGSSFTVGVAEEERNTVSVTEIANALTKWRPQQPVTSFPPLMNQVKSQLIVMHPV